MDEQNEVCVLDIFFGELDSLNVFVVMTWSVSGRVAMFEAHDATYRQYQRA